MVDDATELAVARFRDGLKSDRKELNQIAVFQLNKLLSDHEKSEQVAELIVAQDTPKLICNLLFQDHKPEVKECATCALAALAGRAAESGAYMIQSMSTFAESDGCDLKCRENIVCAFCNFSMADAMHVQLIEGLPPMEHVVELLVVGSNLAKRATAGLLTNLAGGETPAAREFRRSANDAGAVGALRAMSSDPTVTLEVAMGPTGPLTHTPTGSLTRATHDLALQIRHVAALALQNLKGGYATGVLGNLVALCVPVVIAIALYWGFAVMWWR